MFGFWVCGFAGFAFCGRLIVVCCLGTLLFVLGWIGGLVQ